MRVPLLGVRLPRPLPRAPWHQVGLPRGLRVPASAQPALPFSPYHTWLTSYVLDCFSSLLGWEPCEHSDRICRDERVGKAESSGTRGGAGGQA